VKAASSLKEKRLRLILPREDWQRLASVVSVIGSELTNYQQALAESGQFNAGDRDSYCQPDQLKLLSCLQLIWPNFEQLIERAKLDEKNRLIITDTEASELRVLNYCARYLPDTTIAWLEFQLALKPVLDVLDYNLLEQIMSIAAPRMINCSVDDLKRGRKVSHPPVSSSISTQHNTDELDQHNQDLTTDDPMEFDGFDWKV
jgi:hypothetical protein